MECVLLKAFFEYTALKEEKIKVRKYLKQQGNKSYLTLSNYCLPK